MSTDAYLKSLIDRVLRLKEEQDELSKDIRDIYGEAKSAGFDKTVMGKLVSHLRKLEKEGRDAVDEAESVFDTYLSAYQRASGTVVATHTHEERFDPTTGEFLEDAPVTIIDRSDENGHRLTVTADPEIAAILSGRREQNTEIAPASQGEPESPSAEAEVAGANAGGEDVDGSAERASSVATSSGPDAKRASNSPEQAPEFLTKAEEEAEAKGAVTVDTASRDEENRDHQHASESGPTDGRRQGGVEPSAAAVAPAPSFIAKPRSVLRPHCLNPGENCGGYGDKHCHSCLKALREGQKAEEIA